MDRYTHKDPLNPLQTAEQYSLTDLIPLEDLQKLQDTLAEIHHVASVITDPHGNPLTLPSNEISVCRLIHHTSDGFEYCMQVSRSMAGQIVKDRQRVCRPCERLGIQKAAVPIFIDDQHLANWWISQICEEPEKSGKVRKYAKKIGLDADLLMEAFEAAPRGSETVFNKVLDWIERLTRQLAMLGYHNHRMAQDLGKLNRLEDELEKHRFQMEALVQERTAELIMANKRLQLEVLERDMAEEQISRKSKLLDAINHILQQTLTDNTDRSLAKAFLSMARKITASPYGFIAEKIEGDWQVAAIQEHEDSQDLSKKIQYPDLSEISRIWRQMIETGKPISVPVMEEALPWHPLPSCHPNLKSLLAVPLSKKQLVAGFIALADNEVGYALVDQIDIEALSQAFSETLMRKRLEKAKTVSEKRLNLALESGNEGLWDYTPLTGHIYYSPRWFAMLGYVAEEFPETLETWHTLTHPDELPILEDALESLCESRQSEVNIEIRMLSRSGQWRWIQARGRTVAANDAGLAERIVGTLIDVSKYKQVEVALQKANNELQRLAALDDLTQIANRRRFDDRLAQEWRRGQREAKPLGVIICDIDHFKEYNDTYGHPKGDDALYAVAQCINAALKRPMDLVARIGGEEFAMILPNTDIAGARRVANEVKDALEELKIRHRTSKVGKHITLSFGVAAIMPAVERSSKKFINAADRALYRAKAQGRDRIVCAPAEEEMEDGATSEIDNDRKED